MSEKTLWVIGGVIIALYIIGKKESGAYYDP